MYSLLSPSQAAIVHALARYKFLTTSQMITLGISRRRSNLSVMLRPLKKSKYALVGEIAFGFVPSKGRLENFYYLKTRAKKIIQESGWLEAHEIKLPLGRNVLFTQDYFHRKYTIDCHIACDQSAHERGVTVMEFDRYFDKVGNNRTTSNLQAKTKIAIEDDYLIADATLLLQKEETTRLFALELYNDKDSKRIVTQLTKHLIGVKNSSLCTIYGIEKGHRVLSVFTHPASKEKVMQQLREQPFSEYLLFHDYETLGANFFEGWVDVAGNEVLIDE